MIQHKSLVLVALLTLVLATSPLFFSIYREAAFNTVPRDDYAPCLLALVGHGDHTLGAPVTQADRTLGAPFVYRIGSVAVAVPFYYILPTYAFTNLRSVEPDYLKATQALCFASYLWILLTSLAIYAIARTQYKATRASSLIVGLLAFFLTGFITTVAVDPFAILVISLLVLCRERPVPFALLVLSSVCLNEKIPIVLATVFGVRLVVSAMRKKPFTAYAQLFFSCIAVAGYFAVVSVLKVPGYEEQRNPALFLGHLRATAGYTSSLKGMVLNVVPMVVLVVLVVLAMKFGRAGLFQPCDVSGLVVLVLISMIADVVYNVGRISMYSYPLYLPAISGFVDEALGIGWSLEGAG